MTGNVGVERRGRWEMEFSKDRRSIWFNESQLELRKSVEQGRRVPEGSTEWSGL